MAAPIDLKEVAEPGRRSGYQRREKIGIAVAGEYRERVARAGMHGDHRAGAGQQRPDREAGAGLVRAEHRERVAVFGAHQRIDFGIGQQGHWSAGFPKDTGQRAGRVVRGVEIIVARENRAGRMAEAPGRSQPR